MHTCYAIPRLRRRSQDSESATQSRDCANSQIARNIYTENVSKNRSGGFAQFSVEHKVVPVYASTAGPKRCHVQILDLYLSKLPTKAIQADTFYVCPLQSVPKIASKPWLTAVPVGWNTLTSLFREMCAEVGVQD